MPEARKPALRAQPGEWLGSLPSLLWLALFFVVPTVLVFTIAFRPAEINGGIGQGWTLETLQRLMQPTYPSIIWRTLWLSVVCTVVCIGLALPAGYWLARLDARWRGWILMLVILPFWTNFLIRIYAWKSLLHPEGWVKDTLVFLRLADVDTPLLYNSGAILLVLVYSYLPFALLPIYAAAEKFDFGLLDAARDLGSTRLGAFWRVFVPGITRGIGTAVLVVLIPAFGSYAIPDLVGGPSSEMIGNKIAQRVFIDRNLPHASGLSAILALIVILPVILILWGRARSENAARRGANP